MNFMLPPAMAGHRSSGPCTIDIRPEPFDEGQPRVAALHRRPRKFLRLEPPKRCDRPPGRLPGPAGPEGQGTQRMAA
jgi:hypothetical protein